MLGLRPWAGRLTSPHLPSRQCSGASSSALWAALHHKLSRVGAGHGGALSRRQEAHGPDVERRGPEDAAQHHASLVDVHLHRKVVPGEDLGVVVEAAVGADVELRAPGGGEGEGRVGSQKPSPQASRPSPVTRGEPARYRVQSARLTSVCPP